MKDSKDILDELVNEIHKEQLIDMKRLKELRTQIINSDRMAALETVCDAIFLLNLRIEKTKNLIDKHQKL